MDAAQAPIGQDQMDIQNRHTYVIEKAVQKGRRYKFQYNFVTTYSMTFESDEKSGDSMEMFLPSTQIQKEQSLSIFELESFQ